MGKWFAYLIVLIVLGVSIALDSRAIDAALISVVWTFYLVVTVLVLWKMWRTRGDEKKSWESGHGVYGVLPRKWRLWIFGESDKKPGD
jgi:hypothetical protein